MMGVNYITYKGTTLSQDNWLFYRNCLGWQLRLAILPKRCNITGKLIWLEYGYRGTSLHRIGDTHIEEHKWHNKHEHLIWLLKL